MTLLVAAGVVVVLNFDYFRQNFKYTFRKPISQLTPGDKTTAVQIGPNTLVIDSLGIVVPVQYATEATEQAFQVALVNGVVHYPGTAMPGEYGNVYIFGHSSDNAWSKGHYKTIFAILPRIQKGDRILLTDNVGRRYVYAVMEQFVAGARDVQYLDQGDRKKRLLTLQTSWPIGTSLKRYVVRAELLEK